MVRAAADEGKFFAAPARPSPPPGFHFSARPARGMFAAETPPVVTPAARQRD
jgi:hypothetical protein